MSIDVDDARWYCSKLREAGDYLEELAQRVEDLESQLTDMTLRAESAEVDRDAFLREAEAWRKWYENYDGPGGAYWAEVELARSASGGR